MRTIIMGAIILLAAVTSECLAHCQIPCGIYDDEMRAEMIAENITTIEKAMRQIESLSSADKPDYNQIVRWINVKDEHADTISDIVSWYFLQQRVKPVKESEADAHEAYMHRLMLLHEMLVYSMKAKQTIDLANVEKLKTLLEDFEKAYFGHVLGDERHGH